MDEDSYSYDPAEARGENSSSEGFGGKLADLLGPTPGENGLLSLASKYLPIAMLLNSVIGNHGAQRPGLPPWMTSAGPHAPMAPSSEDYYTYGAPSPQIGMGAGASMPSSGAPQGAAEGGELVHGDGSGRDDEINAKLSDGEYVMDAETVALLGDGSVEEGARRLDQLRENIRKHKGASLAKGKFSPNAKPANSYLQGAAGKDGDE